MSQIEPSFDRHSVADADAVMSELFPDVAIRREILRCLLESIAMAERRAPNAWAVTLFGNGFRLNVGQVEALTCELVAWPFETSSNGPIILRLLAQGTLPENITSPSDDAGELEVSSAPYKSVPQPLHVLTVEVRHPMQLKRCFDLALEPHRRFIDLAAVTPTGKPRTSTAFRRTHSEGLVQYAKSLCPDLGDSHAQPAGAQVNRIEASDDEFFEGRPITVQTTRYERDRNARRACLAHHGYACAACGFTFSAIYGTVAEDYIQVHHLNPIASIGHHTLVDPIADMVPLCANCHAVAHFRDPPYTIQEIKDFINKEIKS